MSALAETNLNGMRKIMSKEVIENNESGFTLIEAMVVMIVGVLVLAAAAAGINRLFDMQRLAKAAENIEVVYTNMAAVGSSEKGFDGVKDNAAAIALGIYPQSMLVVTGDGKTKATTVQSAFGSEVNIVGTAPSYTLTYNNVPATSCVKLLTKLRSSGWDSMATAVGTGGDGTAVSNLSVNSSLADIAGACGSSGKMNVSFSANHS